MVSTWYLSIGSGRIDGKSTGFAGGALNSSGETRGNEWIVAKAIQLTFPSHFSQLILGSRCGTLFLSAFLSVLFSRRIQPREKYEFQAAISMPCDRIFSLTSTFVPPSINQTHSRVLSFVQFRNFETLTKFFSSSRTFSVSIIGGFWGIWESVREISVLSVDLGSFRKFLTIIWGNFVVFSEFGKF